jgi:hypothetical protein
MFTSPLDLEVMTRINMGEGFKLIQARILPRFGNREITGQKLPPATESYIILKTNLCRKNNHV